ncbi:MAG: biotin-dependent carboxyltransferase family protein [Hydrogenibacillus sp.]|nr:biotin-dependent carboxyltransferase family protein [Hydrogenibacillus sp.]
MAIVVEKGGLLSTVQDLGRHGYRSQGVPPAGAMDVRALRLANALVGNPPDAAALEVTIDGPVLRFLEGRLVAVAGGAPVLSVRHQRRGEDQAVKRSDAGSTEVERQGEASVADPGGAPDVGRPFFVPAGGRLHIGALKTGARALVAVAGGIDVPVVLGSRSTYLPARFGGHHGRPLTPGDVLPLGNQALGTLPEAAACAAANRWRRVRLATDLLHGPHDVYEVRFIPGPEWGWLDERAQAAFVGAVFTVHPQSNRMGYRLSGPVLHLQFDAPLYSAAVDWGTIQLPPDGRPIVLMADHQTTGGYPRIGSVAAVDRSLLSQLRPGDRLAFVRIGHAQAEALLRAEMLRIRTAEKAIRLKWAEILRDLAVSEGLNIGEQSD